MTETKKETKSFVKIAIVGYVEAAQMLDFEAVKKQQEKLKQIKNIAHENMQVEKFNLTMVNRLVAREAKSKAEAFVVDTTDADQEILDEDESTDD